jgi:hypothetical protein
MTSRRPLAEMMTDVAAGAADAAANTPLVRVVSVEVTLPVEIVLRRSGTDWELLGDLPRNLTRTAFDVEPARLAIVWAAMPATGAES